MKVSFHVEVNLEGLRKQHSLEDVVSEFDGWSRPDEWDEMSEDEKWACAGHQIAFEFLAAGEYSWWCQTVYE